MAEAVHVNSATTRAREHARERAVMHQHQVDGHGKCEPPVCVRVEASLH